MRAEQRIVMTQEGVVCMEMNVYNHLIPRYYNRPKPLTKYDTHKASELRNIVNRITKLTQESPIYMVRMTDAKQSYVLGVKESAIMLQNGFKELSDDSQGSAFNNKKAYSSDMTKVGAEFIGDDSSSLPEEFNLRIENLAENQLNYGKEMYSTGKALSGGTYKFQVSVADDIYDFQYNVRNDANNKEIAEGLSSFINKANIGIKAGVEVTDKRADMFRMYAKSDMTGSASGEPIFSLTDKNNVDGRGIVSVFNLNNIEREPRSSTFYMDGVKKHTLSNEFTVSKCLRVSLKETSDNDINIKYMPDSERIMDSLSKVADAYNYMIDGSHEYDKVADNKVKLEKEMKAVIEPFKPELEANGFKFDENGKISFDEALTIQSINDGDMRELFSEDSPIVKRMINKTDEIKINPIEYVDKLMSTYPNFDKPPRGYSYITSFYSGLIFNFYC